MKRFIGDLSESESTELLAAMNEVESKGLQAARHLRGDIYEVRSSGDRRILRVLLAAEGRRVFLALEAFAKQTQKTPPGKIKLAEARLKDWRARART